MLLLVVVVGLCVCVCFSFVLLLSVGFFFFGGGCCCCGFFFFFFFFGGGGVQADARTWVFGLAWLLYVCFYRELDLLFIVSATFTSCVVPGAVQRVQHLHDDRKKST